MRESLVVLVLLCVACGSSNGSNCQQEEVTCTSTCDDLYYECSGSQHDQYSGNVLTGQFTCSAGHCAGVLAWTRNACSQVGRTLKTVHSPKGIDGEWLDRVEVCSGDQLPAGGGAGTTGGGNASGGGLVSSVAGVRLAAARALQAAAAAQVVERAVQARGAPRPTARSAAARSA